MLNIPRLISQFTGPGIYTIQDIFPCKAGATDVKRLGIVNVKTRES